MAMHLAAHDSRGLLELVRVERRAFAAKIRMVRAVLGWSQGELAFRVGLTQRAVHKLEQGETEPRRTSVRALEEVWREQNIEFEDMPDGGFRVAVRAGVLERPATAPARRRRATRYRLGITETRKQ
jgi:transcriptional regulator with XRE-family HTH domain